MEIKIWSDIRCPFCYIGKHKFENALEKFAHKDEVRVSWYSFELDPTIKTDPKKSDLEHLVETKGMSQEQLENMLEGATKMGQEMG
ncbi:MAG TPA: DsbA family protein, partial [Flavobacteriaceae bacterium]|nr:DsbA family protein [Flavobacteriaceae bacterium]